MGIEAWSTTAASNNASPPDGAPEGMAAGSINDVIRQNMASVRAQCEDAQWFNWGHAPTRIDGDTFSVSGDLTAIYHVGRRLKVTGSATGYATIRASAYSAPNTNVDVTMDSGSLPATLSAVYVAILSATNPSIPAQTNPTWTGAATGGSLTLSTPLAVTSGGTGASTVAGARSALGVSATGSDTTYLFRANNLSDITSSTLARANLGLTIGTNVPSTTGGGASGTWSINISGNAATATSASSASTLSSTLGIASGGTSATSAASARSNLGLNIGSDVPSPTGTGASGTWGINISGNAATATSATSASSASTASALSGNITESQITDGSLLARIGANETITGTWVFNNLLWASSGTNSVGRDLLNGIVTASALTGSVGDWAPGISACNLLLASANSASFNISGLAGAANGQIILLWNTGSNAFNLLHQDAGATAANRFITQSGATKTLNAGCGAWMFYDASASRWRVGLLV